LRPGCTGCGACLLVCPDLCFEVYRYEVPVEHTTESLNQNTEWQS
jgi:Fe-S-cluster-containing hydrogenase component 2